MWGDVRIRGMSDSATSTSASTGEERLAAACGQAEHLWMPSQFQDKRAKKAARKAARKAEAQALKAEEAAQREAAKCEGVRFHKRVREYSLGEEIANAVTHGVGAGLAVAAIPITVVTAVHHGGGVLLAAALIYSISMLLEYLASTLYHALAVDGAKRVFKVLDHAAIYLFIAGSYTPFCLVTFANAGGIYLCAFVWALAVVGMAVEAFWVFRPRWLSVAIYLVMGWCVVAYLPALIANLATPGLWLLVAGGVCYSIGCIFYVLKRVPYMHSVFHLWVLAGSILQFLSIVLYVL